MFKIDKNKLRVAVLCGGFQPEHHGSLLTGKTIHNALKESGYKKAELIIVDSKFASELNQQKIDFAFMAMLNRWGEDGAMQGFLEVAGIPYSGSGVEASAVCKNKYLFTKFAESHGIKVPKTKLYESIEEIKKDKSIKLPVVIKPNHHGYSVGVALAQTKTELIKLSEKAFQHGSSIILQEFIKGREFTIGILELPHGEIKPLPIIEVKLKGSKIQDQISKDNPDLLEEIIPAQITNSLTKKIEKQAVGLFKELGCSGVSRMDLIVDRDEDVYFLENNTCPGFVSLEGSDLPKQLQSAGISTSQYVDYMILNGLNRKQDKKDTERISYKDD